MAKRKLSKQQKRRIDSKQKGKIKDDLTGENGLQLDESSTQTARVISHHGRQLFAETEELKKIKCKIRQNLGDIACGDYVIVLNADKVAVTGRRLDQKNYYRHSGYPGGISSITLREQLETAAAQHGFEVIVPPIGLCTDNAVMGAIAVERIKAGQFEDLSLDIRPGLMR